jgi:opacity protein-like surface antigen
MVALTAVTVLAVASPLRAQQRWAVEFRANGALPTQDIGADELNNGIGLEGTVRYNIFPHLAIYAGWDWIHFGTESLAGADADVEETGYAFGARFEHPFKGETGTPAWWLRVGGTWDHVEIEDDAGDIIADSGHGLGWEVGAGLSLAVKEAWTFTPGLRYRSLSHDIRSPAFTSEVDLRYITFEIGVAFAF